MDGGRCCSGGKRGKVYDHSLYEAAAVVNSAQALERVLGSIVEMTAKALEARRCRSGALPWATSG
jgi:hypothetical protein